MKTAFCPGPGMGLYEFCRMPFGVTGGPSSFQRLMDKVHMYYMDYHLRPVILMTCWSIHQICSATSNICIRYLSNWPILD